MLPAARVPCHCHHHDRGCFQSLARGIDGCPGGWLVVLVQPVGDACEIADALRVPQQPMVIAIDMPIGLPERGGGSGRLRQRLRLTPPA